MPVGNEVPLTVREVPARPEAGLRVSDAAAAGVAGITSASSEIIMATAKILKVLLFFI